MSLWIEWGITGLCLLVFTLSFGWQGWDANYLLFANETVVLVELVIEFGRD